MDDKVYGGIFLMLDPGTGKRGGYRLLATKHVLALVGAFALFHGIAAGQQLARATLTRVGITLAPVSVTLTASQSRQFTARVANAANRAVTWSLRPAVGTISSTGLYTAPASIATSQTIIV